jgi:hypothetical protein
MEGHAMKELTGLAQKILVSSQKGISPGGLIQNRHGVVYTKDYHRLIQ